MGSNVNAGTSVLVQMEVPNEADLCCFTASVNPEDGKDPSATSPYHCQIFRCRLLLFTSPVLASPVYGTERDVLVVASKEDQQLGKLDGYLIHAKLRRTSAMRHVTNTDYSSCLLYTLRAYLSPEWNLVGDDLLVQGRDFLSSRGARDAVSLNVNVYGETASAWLAVAASRVVLPRQDLDDLQLSAQDLNEFLTNPHCEIESRSIGNPWVHVYPSMKKGMVMKVTRRIPPTSLYQTYKDLRRHWKNMYGLRLPGDSAEMVYCEVYFRPLGWTMYTYPLMCLGPHPPARLRALDPQAVIKGFLEHLVLRLPEVCGRRVRVHADTLNLTVTALQSARESDGAARHNLQEGLATSLSGQRSKPRPFWRLSTIGEEGEAPLSLSERTEPETEPDSHAGKENSYPNKVAAQQRPEPLRPVFTFRPHSSGSNRPIVPERPKLKPIFTPTFNRSEPKRGPLMSASASKPPEQQPSASLAVPTYKPIFLAIKPKVPEKPKAPKAAPKPRPSPGASGNKRPRPDGVLVQHKTSSPRPPARPVDPSPDFTAADQVRKANVQTLLAWLRAQGVPCRVKDKKAELVEKVLNKLKLQ